MGREIWHPYSSWMEEKCWLIYVVGWPSWEDTRKDTGMLLVVFHSSCQTHFLKLSLWGIGITLSNTVCTRMNQVLICSCLYICHCQHSCYLHCIKRLLNWIIPGKSLIIFFCWNTKNIIGTYIYFVYMLIIKYQIQMFLFDLFIIIFPILF